MLSGFFSSITSWYLRMLLATETKRLNYSSVLAVCSAIRSKKQRLLGLKHIFLPGLENAAVAASLTTDVFVCKCRVIGKYESKSCTWRCCCSGCPWLNNGTFSHNQLLVEVSIHLSPWSFMDSFLLSSWRTSSDTALPCPLTSHQSPNNASPLDRLCRRRLIIGQFASS